MRKLTVAVGLALSLIVRAAVAQGVPPPVPALPDTQRIGTFNITASTCACSVPFAFFADQTDYQNWVKVYVNGAQVQYNDPTFGWTITSPTGVIGLIPQPITDAILTFNTAQSGVVQIVGARRPRRVTQFQEGRGVAARDLNEALTDIVAQNRENWDLAGSALHGIPGATYGAVPSNCPNSNLGFDASGLNFVCTATSQTGVSNYLASVVASTTGSVLPNTPAYSNGSLGVGATLTASSNGALALDGVSLVATSRVLIKDQASALQNGVYSVTQTGSASLPYILTRVTDFDQPGEMITATGIIVTGGTANSGSGWLLTGTVTAVGSTPALFTLFFAGPSTTSVTSLGGIRGNIGLGTGLAIAGSTLTASSSVFNITQSPFNALCNYGIGFTATMGAGSNVLLTSSPQFSAGDVGKYIIVQGAGAGAATLVSAITAFTNSQNVTLANASTPGVSNVEFEYGNDDAPAINAAVAAAVAAGGGTVYIPANKSCMISQLNLTGIGTGMTIRGEGVSSSRLMPLQTAAYSTTHGHVIDLTGSSQLILDNFQVGTFQTLAVASTGLFIAQTASDPSNRIRLRNVYVTGQYSGATLYIYGVPSWDAIASDFYNYFPGAGNHGVAYLTQSNAFNYTSSFATVATPPFGPSDVHFFDCEFHKFGGTGADNWVIRIDGGSNDAWYGGVINGGASAYVFFDGTNAHIAFFGVTGEAEGPATVTIPANAFFKNSGTVTDLVDPGSSWGISGAKFSPSSTTTNLVTNAF